MQLAPVASILLGALFTVAVATALGVLLLRALHVIMTRGETLLFAFLSGSACLSTLVFLLCLIHQAKTIAFLTIGVVAMLASVPSWRSHSWLPRRHSCRRFFSFGKGAAAAWSVLLLAPFFVCYLIYASAPEVSPDGAGYHLGNVARFLRNAGFTWDFHSVYASLPQGIEMLFLMAYSMGRHSAAALVHLAFLTALPLLLISYGSRFDLPRAGAFAAILAFASPVLGIDGASAYNDAAVATLLFAEFFLLQVWHEEKPVNLLILSGLLCGYTLGVKLTFLAMSPLPLLWIVWKSNRKTRDLAVFGASAAVIAAPWILRNWIWLGNPAAPFLNSVFPNPYWSAASEHTYLEGLRHYPGHPSAWEIARQVTTLGGFGPGLLGPIFLLAPLSLLACRTSQGRRLLTAAAVAAIPAWFNAEVRFLIPAIPFVAMALGIALGNSPGVLPALAVFHAVLSWPSVLSTYCDPNAWRIREAPVRAALRLEPESPYIRQHISAYGLKDAIEQNVPSGATIFSPAGRPAGYIARDIVVSYESTQGEQILHMLQQANAEAVKGQGIRYLLIDDSDHIPPDHLTAIARTDETTLYRID